MQGSNGYTRSIKAGSVETDESLWPPTPLFPTIFAVIEFSDSTGELSDAIALGRLVEAPDRASHLREKIRNVAADASRFAAPFAVILESAARETNPMGQTGLAGEFEVVRYCLAKGLHVQAITALREWIVSFVCERLGEQRLGAGRKRSEDALNYAVSVKTAESKGEPAERLEDFIALANHEEIRDLWGRVRDVRNDTAHCGMNKQPAGTKSIIERIETLVAEVEPWIVALR